MPVMADEVTLLFATGSLSSESHAQVRVSAERERVLSGNSLCGERVSNPVLADLLPKK